MNKQIALLLLSSTLFVGCASVPMESAERTAEAKKFLPPSDGKAGVYIYRNSFVGQALKKDVWIDGECIGETAPDVFFYEQVAGDTEHKISTESEFSPNDLMVATESGKNYFVRQYIKMGAFVGGAGVELVDEAMGMEAVAGLSMAKQGVCSQ